MYQQPITDCFILVAQQLFMAGSGVINNGVKIMPGGPDATSINNGDQASHPADGKRWDAVGWDLESSWED